MANIKRIGIDARFYGPLGKGLGRYTQEITDNIIKLDAQNEYVVFLGRENFNNFQCDGKRVKKVLADVRWYGLAEQIVMPFLIWKNKIDLMHFPHFNVPVFCPAKFIVTIHDLILTKFPTVRATTLGPVKYKLKNYAYRFVINTAIQRARNVIAVSEFTKNDIIKHFKISPEKIIVTYEGVADFSAGAPEAKDLDFYKIQAPYLLYVGNAYPHKNLEGLLRVFSRAKNKINNLQLALVGKEDYFYKKVKKLANELGLDNCVKFLGYVPDKDLQLLYEKALAYVFPSLYEGFGLPPLEAMAFGCPVISSNKASMPEILGGAALYFNPEDEDDFLEKIKLIAGNENLRRELAEKGRAIVVKYDWNECAKKTLAVYLAAMN